MDIFTTFMVCMFLLIGYPVTNAINTFIRLCRKDSAIKKMKIQTTHK